jgi:hypothetical protein
MVQIGCQAAPSMNTILGNFFRRKISGFNLKNKAYPNLILPQP